MFRKKKENSEADVGVAGSEEGMSASEVDDSEISEEMKETECEVGDWVFWVLVKYSNNLYP